VVKEFFYNFFVFLKVVALLDKIFRAVFKERLILFWWVWLVVVSSNYLFEWHILELEKAPEEHLDLRSCEAQEVFFAAQNLLVLDFNLEFFQRLVDLIVGLELSDLRSLIDVAECQGVDLAPYVEDSLKEAG